MKKRGAHFHKRINPRASMQAIAMQRPLDTTFCGVRIELGDIYKIQEKPPMFDYEAVKRFYFEKGHSDPAGKGRFESAFYHTIKFVHDQVREQTLAESAVEVEAMKADIKTLCDALKTTSEGNAKLLAEVAMLRTGDTCGRQCEGTAYRIELQRMKRKGVEPMQLDPDDPVRLRQAVAVLTENMEPHLAERMLRQKVKE